MTKEEVLKSLEKRVKQLEFSIEMFTKTIGEITLLDDGRDHKIAISELARTIGKNREEQLQLSKILDGNYSLEIMRGLQLPDEYIFALLSDVLNEDKQEINEDVKQKVSKEVLPDGVIGQICGYNILEPIKENYFIVSFPENFGIISSDVESYTLSKDILAVQIRNNVTCPLIQLNKIDTTIKHIITITTLTGTGTPLYDIECTVDKMDTPKISGGDYSSSEPQRISLRFHISKTKIQDRRK